MFNAFYLIVASKEKQSLKTQALNTAQQAAVMRLNVGYQPQSSREEE